MPNQINISFTATQNNNGLNVTEAQSVFYTATGSLNQVNTQIIANSWQQLSSSVSSNLAYLILYNTNPSTGSLVAISTAASAANITDYLGPNDFCIKSWTGSGTFYASSSVATSSIVHVLPISN